MQVPSCRINKPAGRAGADLLPRLIHDCYLCKRQQLVFPRTLFIREADTAILPGACKMTSTRMARRWALVYVDADGISIDDISRFLWSSH